MTETFSQSEVKEENHFGNHLGEMDQIRRREMNSRGIKSAMICALAVVTLFTVTAVAQTSSFSGDVKDSSGSPVSGATITLTEASRNQQFNVTTNESGLFTFPA